jgi:hypothetical protein
MVGVSIHIGTQAMGQMVRATTQYGRAITPVITVNVMVTQEWPQ